MSSDGEPERKQDVVFVQGPAEDGEGYRIVRKRDDTIELGEIRPVQDGKPLHGDLVRLSPRKDHDRLFDVEVLVSKEEAQGGAASAAAEGARTGPAQVASAAYRSNWETIFGGRKDPGLLN